MTHNQADAQGAIRQGSQSTTWRLPTRIPGRFLSNNDDDLPPYSKTDSSGPSSTFSLPQPPLSSFPPPRFSPPSLEEENIPELGPIDTREAVVLQGPLRILGSIQSSSQASLQHNIHVEGDLKAGNDISILHDVFVTGNVECRTKVILSDGVNVVGKVIGRYGIEFSTLSTMVMDSFNAIPNNHREVFVGGNVKSGVSTLLGGREMNIRIAGSISQRGGSMLIEGDVQIGGGLDVHGGVSIRSFEDRIVVIGGNSTINGVMSTEGDITIANLDVVGTLNIEGRLHIRGTLKVQGYVYLKKSGKLTVDGKKTIKGVFKEVREFTFKD